MLQKFAMLAVATAVGLFLCMLLFLELGHRLGLHRAAKIGADSRAGVGVVESSVYGLLALLIGFMFSGAAGRFDHRRQLIADEVNAAGTAWQRVELLPAEQQALVRDSFRRYVDVLLAWYGESPELAAATTREPATLTRARNEVWSLSVEACITSTGERARMLLLPSLNEMFDAVDRERVARYLHPPIVIFAMLAVAALASALFAGYAMASGKRRNWIYMIGVAASVSIATYVIIELEYPRLGVVRVNAMDRDLSELRSEME